MTTTTAAPVQLRISPLSGSIGAEIRNVDLHQDLAPDTVAAIRQALLDYKVIFLPGQHLSPEEHKGFATYFGEITNAHPVIPGIGEHREVFEIDYTQARQILEEAKEREPDEHVRRSRQVAHRRHLRRDASARLHPQCHRHSGGRR